METVILVAIGCVAALVAVALLLVRSQDRPFLNPDEFKRIRLVSKSSITHDTRLFRFELTHRKQRLGLPIGQHISFQFLDDNQKPVLRSYTPVSDDDQLGHVDFVIKVYPHGKMSQHLDRLDIGDTLEVRGPKGTFKYRPNMKRAIGMLAGGTGIAPMYQILSAILKNPNDRTQVTLLFGNLTVEDILLKDRLDALVEKHKDRFKLHYVVNSAPEDGTWQGGVGFISADMIKSYFPGPADDIITLRCGPPAMNKAMKAHLDSLGYTAGMQVEFLGLETRRP